VKPNAAYHITRYVSINARASPLNKYIASPNNQHASINARLSVISLVGDVTYIYYYCRLLLLFFYCQVMWYGSQNLRVTSVARERFSNKGQKI